MQSTIKETRIRREGNRAHKVCVKPSELGTVRAAGAAYEDYAARLRELCERRDRLALSIRQHIRTFRQLQRKAR